MATITNFPELHTSAYAELWSADPFIASTWFGAALPSEKKGDERGIGATFKVDVMASCFCIWEGTLPSGRRTLQLVGAERLDNSPGANFLPVLPGVNLIEFVDEPAPPPDEPEPPDEPDPPPLPRPDHVPSTITVCGRADIHVPFAHWRDDDVIWGVPLEWYLETWEAIKHLLGRVT